jgi:hypothetical protein
MREWLPELRQLLDPGPGAASGCELIESGTGA